MLALLRESFVPRLAHGPSICRASNGTRKVGIQDRGTSNRWSYKQCASKCAVSPKLSPKSTAVPSEWRFR